MVTVAVRTRVFVLLYVMGRGMKKRFIVGPSGGFCASGQREVKVREWKEHSTLLVGVCSVGEGCEREHAAL